MELLTSDIRKRLPKLYATTSDRDPVLHVKFFAPWSRRTWWASEFDGRDIFYGLHERFGTEWCFFSLKELETTRGPEGLCIVRDPDFISDFASRVDSRLIAQNRSRRRGLLPDEIRQRLPKPVQLNDDTNPIFLVKFVAPSESRAWYVSAFDGDEWLYGVIEDDGRWLSWSYFSLSELESNPAPNFGPVERDFEFQPKLASEIIRDKHVTNYPAQSVSEVNGSTASLGSLLKQLTATEPVPIATEAGIARLPRETGVVFETNEDTYDHFLDALPVPFMHGNLFSFAEGFDPHTLFFRRGGQYFMRRLTEEETEALCRLANIPRAVCT